MQLQFLAPVTHHLFVRMKVLLHNLADPEPPFCAQIWILGLKILTYISVV